MGHCRKHSMLLGMALASAFGLSAISAFAMPPDGTIISCTMSGPSETRRWGLLEVFEGQCWRYEDQSRVGEEAPAFIAHCKRLGRQLGCDYVVDRNPHE